MLCSTHFSTPVTFVKRNGRNILGLYPDEKLARKMTKAKHVLQRPPGLTIDADTYDQNLAEKDDWRIIFEIDDDRRYFITVSEFNLHKQWIDRGQGSQWVIQFKYLRCDDNKGPCTPFDSAGNTITTIKPRAPQLSLWGESW